MPGYIFPRNEQTHTALLDSIRKRQEEEERQRRLREPTAAEADIFGTTLAPEWQAAQHLRTLEQFHQGEAVAQQPQQAFMSPEIAQPPRRPSVDPVAPTPQRGVGMRGNLWQTREPGPSVDKEGTITSYDLDPLGNEVMITTGPASDKTAPTLHLFPGQVDAIDEVDGYLERLQTMYPNHDVTERSAVPEPGFAETMKFMGTVAWESYDVTQGIIAEPLAHTAVEILPGTEGGGWPSMLGGEGFELTATRDGWLAATEGFRARPVWQQMVFGALFDPFTILAALGLIKPAKLGVGLTIDLISKALKKWDPDISPEDLDRASAYIKKEADQAGAGPYRGEENMPQKADLSYYTPQEILQMGGLEDIDLDGPLPNRAEIGDDVWTAAWDEGLRKIESEQMARMGLEEQSLKKVLDNIANDADRAMETRVVDQLAPGVTDWTLRDQVWRQFIRTAIHALDLAQASDGNKWVPRDFGRETARVIKQERDYLESQQIVKPEGGPRTSAPSEPVESATRMGPQPTVTMEPGAPVDAGSRVRRLIDGESPKERLQQLNDLSFGDSVGDVGLTGFWSFPKQAALGVPRALSKVYEEGQAMFLDKFAPGNAASGRAQKEFLRHINKFVEEDIARVNNQMIKDFAQNNGVSESVAENILRGRNKFVKKGDPGFSPIRRMPSEFNFEWQAALTSGAPGAAVNHSRSVLRNVREIVTHAKSVNGKVLDIDYVNNFLAFRHAIDIIKLKNRANRVQDTISQTGTPGVGLAPSSSNVAPIVNPAAPAHPGTIYGQRRITGPGGQTEAELISALFVIHKDLVGETVIRNVGGREIVTNQWAEMTRAARVVTDHYRNMLDFQVAEGLVTKELADQLKRQYKYYNPIKYIEGTLINVHNIHIDGNQQLIRGVADNDIRTLAEQGIDADIVRPLEHLANVTMRTYLSVFRNRAMKALIPTLLLDPRNRTRVSHVHDDGSELTTSLSTIGRTSRTDLPPADAMRVARMIDGKADIWQVPKEFMPVVDALVAFDQNMAERTLRWINKVPRSLLTAHNPIFFTYNFMHDMLAAFLVEGVMPWNVAADLGRNLKAIFREDEFLNEMARQGAIVGGFGGKSAEEIAQGALRSRYRMPSFNPATVPGHPSRVKGSKTYTDVISDSRGMVPYEKIPRWRKVTDPETGITSRKWLRSPVADMMVREEFDTFTKWRKWATSPIKLIGDVADAVENAPRRSVYGKVRNPRPTGPLRHLKRAAGMGGQGLTKDEAALRARRITVDFQRRGKAVGLVDAAFLYTNAAIQGAMLPVRAGFQMGWMPRLRMGGLMGVSAALYFWNTQDEYGDAFDEMGAIDKYTKQTVIVGHKWHRRFAQKVPVAVAISPLLREWAIGHAAVTYTLQKLRGRSDKAHWQQMVTAMVPSIVPVSHLLNIGGRDGEVAWQGVPTPTAVGNLIDEIATNKDSFRNQPIVSEEMAARPKHLQYDAYTTRAAIQLGGLFNQSPKMMDHWMRMGALRDLAYAADNIQQIFDPEEIDPELTAMANELEEYIDISVPSDDKLQLLPDITGTTPDEREDEWRSKNNVRVTSQFFRDHTDYINTTSKEREELALYLDKKARADREYTVDGQPVAFATNFVNRFVRTQGGNKGRLGALKAAEKFDVSVAETREAAGKLNVLMSQLHDTQLNFDGNLWGGQRESGLVVRLPGDAEQQPGHYMDGQMWIKAHRQKGAFYSMAMYVHAGQLSHAAQLQGIDLSKEYKDWPTTGMENYFIRDAGAWDAYKGAVATGADAWQDTRPLASHLASGYRGITMTELQPGLPDFTTFFKQREEYQEMVEGRSWGPKGKELDGPAVWEMVEEQISATMSATEYEWYQDMASIRDYWDLSRDYLDDIAPSFRPVWEGYLNGNDAERMAMKMDLYKGSIISYVQKQINFKRDMHRVLHPSMDAKYIKWGYATEPKTMAGVQAKTWLLNNVNMYSDMESPAQPTQPLQGGP